MARSTSAGSHPGSNGRLRHRRGLIDTVFTQWFGPTVDIYEIIDIATDRIADRHRVVYRFRVRKDEDDYVCEQTAYFDEVDGKIVTLRILCTGFLPVG